MKKKEIEEAVGNFADVAFVRRDASHAAAFIEEHAMEPADQICFFPIEGLTVHRQVDLAGATLLPPDAVDLPEFIVQAGATMGTGSTDATDAAAEAAADAKGEREAVAA